MGGKSAPCPPDLRKFEPGFEPGFEPVIDVLPDAYMLAREQRKQLAAKESE